ncbi:MAG: DUF5683 domain-containing protein [Porphyromonas sp.]|nr:DUF5683 domain-containing protein [Porphyromonas sp.]
MKWQVSHTVLLALIALLLPVGARAQETIVIEPDSVAVAEPAPSAATVDSKPYEISSKKALLYSIIPGGGQIYNRMYWKLPVVVSAYTACYYAISWNNNNLQDYTIAYRDIKSDTPLENTSWVDFIPYGADPNNYVNNTSFHDQLKRGRDYYRRYRDLSIIVTAAVYILVMMDAYVDAELYKFDISPNVALTCTPTYIPPTVAAAPRDYGSYGLQLALTF